jgi:hypothetical protein
MLHRIELHVEFLQAKKNIHIYIVTQSFIFRQYTFMRTNNPLRTALLAVLVLCSSALLAQTKSFTWDSYKTRFSVPDNFSVTQSTGEHWSGSNGDITMSIFPRKGENLSQRQMKNSVYEWAVENKLRNIGAATELDPEILNGYWGVMYEGTVDEFPVAVMLVVDPDYPDISLYIWVSYREGWVDDVIDMLMSFTPF